MHAPTPLTPEPTSTSLRAPTASEPQTIQSMFGSIAPYYDRANTVLSAGIHALWKRTLVRTSGAPAGAQILDCATGTGDLAFLFERQVTGAQVTACDFCEPMLEKAREKAKKRQSQVHFQWADATQLPFSGEVFDVASISFGIRNVSDPLKALTELGRVVKPGGKVLVLEFGQPESRVMDFLFRFYSQRILPRIGGWLSGQREAYQYLQESSAQFPCGPAFLELAQQTGLFRKQTYRTFQGGIAYLYCLEKNA
jgi:demethylmenaquinone methyltransferase/2-methoxy-6-polyprenyl-1,4-benzoquinol methylase